MDTENVKNEQLIETVARAARDNSKATVYFHTAVADATGMCPSDHKAVDLILRQGGLTAGELSTLTGLASASVTSLIDRLESRGFVRRVRDGSDRRRIKVEAVPERLDELATLFQPLKRGLRNLLRKYDDKQLTAIRDFLEGTAALLRSEADSISARQPEKASSACG